MSPSVPRPPAEARAQPGVVVVFRWGVPRHPRLPTPLSAASSVSSESLSLLRTKPRPARHPPDVACSRQQGEDLDLKLIARAQASRWKLKLDP